MHSPALFVRHREVEVIKGALAAVSGGSSKLVLVEGGKGSGKTALLAAASEAAVELGLAVIRRRGDELGLEPSTPNLEPELSAPGQGSPRRAPRRRCAVDRFPLPTALAAMVPRRSGAHLSGCRCAAG